MAKRVYRVMTTYALLLPKGTESAQVKPAS